MDSLFIPKKAGDHILHCALPLQVRLFAQFNVNNLTFARSAEWVLADPGLHFPNLLTLFPGCDIHQFQVGNITHFIGTSSSNWNTVLAAYPTDVSCVHTVHLYCC